ncbi:MAG: VWA domain-containing protein, partial [Planctomycetota bacterium]
MTFENPLALLGLLLAVPVVILYLRRIRLRRQPVATNVLWERVFAEQPIRSAWQRWRYPASLAVQLTLLALIVAALADPQIPGPRQIVLIIDNSPGMGAADVKPTRLEKAKEAANRLIAGLRPCDRMAALSAGGTVNVCCSLTSDQAVLREALEQVEVPAGQGSTQVDAAVELAGWLLADGPGGTVKVITDGCFDGAAELAKAKGVEIVRVGRRTGNVAITRLQVRRTIPDPRRCQILVELSNFSDKPAECRLEWALEGKPLRPEPITGIRDWGLGISGREPNLSPRPSPPDPVTPSPRHAINLARNSCGQQVFAETITESGRLTARLLCDDVYEADNKASRRVPPVTTHSVVLVTGGNPALEKAILHDRTVE